MKQFWCLLALLAWLVPFCCAEVVIQGRVNGLRKPSDARILVDGHASAIPLVDGTFSIRSLAPGTHEIEILSTDYMFQPARVDVTETNKVRAWVVDEKGQRRSATYPLAFSPKSETKVFQVRETLSYWYLLKNPTVLILVFTVGSMFLMSKLTSNMDPEQLAELQRQQAEMPNLQNLFGLGGEEETDKKDKKDKKKNR